MTRPSLAGIEQRAEAATEGPWEVNGPDEDWAVIHSGPDSVIHAYTAHAPACEGCECGGDEAGHVAISVEDAEFIAASRATVPALTAAIRDVLALHTPETPRRDPDFHHTDRVCIECGDPFPCRTYTALTGHVDTTPKEKP